MEGVSAHRGLPRILPPSDKGCAQKARALRLPELHPVERRSAKLPLRPPYISQRTPHGAPKDFDGSASCGPACMAMIARAIGYRRDLSDYELIVRFGEIGGTTLERGTEVEGIERIAAELGRRSLVFAGSDLVSMRDALARGSMVVANGEYYVMPPHEDPTEREGHFVLVFGVAPNGDFLVHDSEDPLVKTVAPDAMARFLAEHERGGFQVEIEIAPPMSALEKTLLERPRSILRRV